MRKQLALYLTLAALVFGPQTSYARDEGIVSAKELIVSCTSDWGNIAYLEMYASCRAYISGVADILASGQAVGSTRACLPHDITKGKVTEAVIKRMKSQASQESGNAATLVALALARDFPCH